MHHFFRIDIQISTSLRESRGIVSYFSRKAGRKSSGALEDGRFGSRKKRRNSGGCRHGKSSGPGRGRLGGRREGTGRAKGTRLRRDSREPEQEPCSENPSGRRKRAGTGKDRPPETKRSGASPAKNAGNAGARQKAQSRRKRRGKARGTRRTRGAGNAKDAQRRGKGAGDEGETRGRRTGKEARKMREKPGRRTEKRNGDGTRKDALPSPAALTRCGAYPASL